MVTTISSEKEFNEITKKEDLVFSVFFAEWCGACKMYHPIYTEVSSERKDVKIINIDVEKQTELADRFDVRSIPTTIIFKKGKEVGKFLGFISKEELNEWIDKAIKSKKGWID